MNPHQLAQENLKLTREVERLNERIAQLTAAPGLLILDRDLAARPDDLRKFFADLSAAAALAVDAPRPGHLRVLVERAVAAVRANDLEDLFGCVRAIARYLKIEEPEAQEAALPPAPAAPLKVGQKLRDITGIVWEIRRIEEHRDGLFAGTSTLRLAHAGDEMVMNSEMVGEGKPMQRVEG